MDSNRKMEECIPTHFKGKIPKLYMYYFCHISLSHGHTLLPVKLRNLASSLAAIQSVKTRVCTGCWKGVLLLKREGPSGGWI